MNNNILLCSENPEFLNEIRNLIGEIGYTLRHVTQATEVSGLEIQYKPTVALIEATEKNSSDKNELLKTYDIIYNKFRQTKIVVVYKNILPFDPDQIGGRKQNLTFLQRSFEDELLISYLLEYAPIEIPSKKLKIEHLNPIRLSDIRPSDKFNFDLYFYMPINKKILLYRRKNSTLSANQISKFEKFHIHDLYVRKNEMHSVQEYLAAKLKNTFGNKNLPATERRAKLQKEIREVFGSFFDPKAFDYQKNRIVLNTCKQVVGKFITDISPNPEVYAQILYYTSQEGSNYNHSVNVSVFSTLFALALGIEDVEPLAIGSMLHDIGFSRIPPEIANRPYEFLKGEDKKIYETHVTLGFKLLENKKFLSTDIVKSIVLSHHERMDGKGFPHEKKGAELPIETRICQIADELDELTSIRPGRSLQSPLDALQKMIKENNSSEGDERFDGELLKKILEVLVPPNVSLIDLEKVKESMSTPAKIPANPNGVDQTDLKRRKRYKKAS